jgi:chromate transport protein ChrA
LGGALISAFILFNQLMFWSLFEVKRSQGEVELAGRFDLGSIIVGALWLIGALWAWGVSQPKRVGDAVIAFAALLAVLGPRFVFEEPLTISCLLFIANFLIACRLYRGSLVLWQSSKKKEK